MLLRLTSSTLAVIAMTAPAALSLTADDVWQTWESYLTDSGYAVTVGEREAAGDALTLRDVVLSIADPARDLVSAVTVPVIRMGPTGGADIRSEFPEPITFRVESAEADGDLVVVGSFDATGSETISREEGGQQSDSVTLPEGVLTLNSIHVDGDTLGTDPLVLVLRDLRSSSLYGGGADLRTESSMGGAMLTIDMHDSDAEATISGGGEFGAMQFTSDSRFPQGHDSRTPEALAEALRAGARISGQGSIESLQFDLDMQGVSDSTGAPEQIVMQTQSGPVSVDVGLVEGRLNYQVDFSELAMAMQGGDLPIPVDVGIDSVSVDLQFPLLAGDDAQPFKFAYSLGALSLNDDIWGLMDPQAALPRDPADLDLDLTGDLILRQDLLTMAENPDAAMVDTPILPVNLILNQLALSAVGANVNAEGTLRYPDPGNFEVMAGALYARFQGINALLDRLQGAGLVGQDEVGGVRMMMMMFAKPVDGQEDTLETRLEVNEEGSIFANGVQIQ